MVREHVPRPQARHLRIQAADVGHSAAQHDDLRVEDVDHRSERPGQPLFVAGHCFLMVSPCNLLRRETLSSQLQMVASEPGTRQVGLDAAYTTAITERMRQI